MQNDQALLQPIDLDTLCYPRLETLSQIEENIQGVENCITINHRPPFIYASYENVTSKLFPSVFQYTNFDQLSELFRNDPSEYHRRVMRREVRGLAFDDETRKIMSRTMPKFFNVDESEESSKKRVEYLIKKGMDNDHGKLPFVILEKLDGSLCSPIIERFDDRKEAETMFSLQKNNYPKGEQTSFGNSYTSFRLRMRTKLSHTNPIVSSMERIIYNLEAPAKDDKLEDIKDIIQEHVKQLPSFPLILSELTTQEDYLVFKVDQEALYSSEQFLKLQDKTQRFIKFCIDWMQKGFTPLFEFFSQDHKIVIDYGKESFLCLLAIRHTTEGYFLPYHQVKKSADEYGIDCVKECSNVDVLEAAKTASLDNILKAIRGEKGVEGYVMVFESGWMFKVKSVWYSDIHGLNAFLSKSEQK